MFFSLKTCFYQKLLYLCHEFVAVGNADQVNRMKDLSFLIFLPLLPTNKSSVDKWATTLKGPEF
jgi:hypothetical protein